MLLCLMPILQVPVRRIEVVDTPGLFDTRYANDENVKLQFAKLLRRFPDGVHAFIYVLNGAACRFTEEEQKTLNVIEVIELSNHYRWHR